MEDVEVEEGFMATFKVKLDLGYPRARVLFYRNDILILNDQRHEICKFIYFSFLFDNQILFNKIVFEPFGSSELTQYYLNSDNNRKY